MLIKSLLVILHLGTILSCRITGSFFGIDFLWTKIKKADIYNNLLSPYTPVASILTVQKEDLYCMIIQSDIEKRKIE